MAIKRGSISLPKEMDPAAKSVTEQANSAADSTIRRMSNMQDRSDESVNRLAAILQRTGGPDSPKFPAGRGGRKSGWDEERTASPPVSPTILKKSFKMRGSLPDQMPHAPVSELLRDAPGSPETPSPSPGLPGEKRRKERPGRGKQRSSLPEESFAYGPGVNRLRDLRDIDGLDSPTILRHGNNMFAEGQADSSSASNYNGSSMRKTSSVPDLSPGVQLKDTTSSSLAVRRSSTNSSIKITPGTSAANIRQSWRDELPDVRSVMKLDERMTAKDFHAKLYKTEEEVEEEVKSGKLVNAKSYRLTKQSKEGESKKRSFE